jgi:hypothetical protein
MNEKEIIEELINKHYNPFREASIRDIEQFKKEMLKLLLTSEEKLKLIVDGHSGWREDVIRRKYKLKWRDFLRKVRKTNE